MKEYELFEPVKQLFCNAGYKVNAEVLDCDVTAVKDDELIIIELKRSLSVTLLAQAIERQKTGAKVYIAVPKPSKYSPKRFRETLYVIRKLELGLIFVSLRDDLSFAEIVREPEPFFPVGERRAEKKKILKEISGRAVDNNVGGVTQTKIATAFTEKNIFAACIIEKYGTASPKLVKEITGADCTAILGRSYYGWFRRVRTGIYELTQKWEEDQKNYPELTEYYRNKVKMTG